MPEPTDHRAEAVHGFEGAAEILMDHQTEIPPGLEAVAEALIAIGHALLAQDRDRCTATRGHANGHHWPAEHNEVPPDVAEALGRRMEADQSEVRFPVDISDLTQDQP